MNRVWVHNGKLAFLQQLAVVDHVPGAVHVKPPVDGGTAVQNGLFLRRHGLKLGKKRLVHGYISTSSPSRATRNRSAAACSTSSSWGLWSVRAMWLSQICPSGATTP